MARYIGAKCRLSRREKVDLLPKGGVRPLNSKCKFETPPGMHGQRRGRLTSYGIQLRMKQLIKRYYNVLEKQFHNYYKKAARRHGATDENLLQMLESRLDNVVYRCGFAATRAEARQLVSHRLIKVNGKIVNIASYLVAPNDQIEISERGKKQARIIAALSSVVMRPIPDWLSLNVELMQGIFKRYPTLDEMPPEFKVHQVVELYSK